MGQSPSRYKLQLIRDELSLIKFSKYYIYIDTKRKCRNKNVNTFKDESFDSYHIIKLKVTRSLLLAIFTYPILLNKQFIMCTDFFEKSNDSIENQGFGFLGLEIESAKVAS